MRHFGGSVASEAIQVTIQAHEKDTPEKASFKPLKIFMEFFLKVEVQLLIFANSVSMCHSALD
jgi:hypothetical protein